MPDFKTMIKGMEHKEEKQEVPSTKPKRQHTNVYSADHRHIPMTKTDYVRQGGKWKESGKEDSIISNNIAQRVLSKEGVPFEKSHRLTKKDRFGHSHPYDTFSSISPDGQRRTVWNVDYAKGDENYRKLVRKAYLDRMRYKKKKAQANQPLNPKEEK